MTFFRIHSCSSGIIQDFLDHYMDQCQIFMGYFSLGFCLIDFKPWSHGLNIRCESYNELHLYLNGSTESMATFVYLSVIRVNVLH